MFAELLENILIEVSTPTNLSNLQKKFKEIWKKKELGDGLNSPRKVLGEFWLLSDGNILDVDRHKDAPEMLRVDWDTWLMTGAMRGLIVSGSRCLNLEKHVLAKTTLKQVRVVADIIANKDIRKLYFDVVSDEDINIHSSEEIDLSNIKYTGSRNLLMMLKKVMK